MTTNKTAKTKTAAKKKASARDKEIKSEVSAVINALEALRDTSTGFTFNLIRTGIVQACSRYGIAPPSDAAFGGTEGFDDSLAKLFKRVDAPALSDLFAVTPMLSLDATDKQRVIEATVEILHNPQTPSDLFQAASEFVTDASNRDIEQLMHSAPVLTMLVNSYPEDELMGAVIAARKADQ